MMTYGGLASGVCDYLEDLGVAGKAQPIGSFHGGVVLSIEREKYLAVLLPGRDPDDAMTECLGYLECLGLYGWDVTDEVVVGKGPGMATVLHLEPPLGRLVEPRVGS